MNTLKFPKFNSLPGRALARLVCGQRLTHRSFQNETCSYRLSHFIFVLHEYGWPIKSSEKKAQTNDPIGRKKNYAEYFFSAEDIKNLKMEQDLKLDNFVKEVERFEKKGSKK